MSTAEIKMLIKKCVKTNGTYTAADFSKYIKIKSEKEFTRGQISGALAQLTDSGDIVRVERGLYSGKNQAEQNIDNGPSFHPKTQFKKEALRKLDSMEGMLADFVNSIKVWDLEGEDLEILLIFRELKNSMENARKRCEQ